MKKDKLWFRAVKGVLKIFIKKPKFVFLGEPYRSGDVLLSNHVGSSGPLTLECYSNPPVRLWGTYEMNNGLRSAYHYLVHTYYHQKKGWNLTAARIFCLLAAPLANMFYKGLQLTSTYPDARFCGTIKKSYKILEGGENICIFPEDSSRGYFDKLTLFHEGFITFADYCLKKGKDLSIFVAYFHKKSRTFIVDAPFQYSELKVQGGTRKDIAKRICDRCNELGAKQEEAYNEAAAAKKAAKKTKRK